MVVAGVGTGAGFSTLKNSLTRIRIQKFWNRSGVWKSDSGHLCCTTTDLLGILWYCFRDFGVAFVRALLSTLPTLARSFVVGGVPLGTFLSIVLSSVFHTTVYRTRVIL